MVLIEPWNARKAIQKTRGGNTLFHRLRAGIGGRQAKKAAQMVSVTKVTASSRLRHLQCSVHTWSIPEESAQSPGHTINNSCLDWTRFGRECSYVASTSLLAHSSSAAFTSLMMALLRSIHLAGSGSKCTRNFSDTTAFTAALIFTIVPVRWVRQVAENIGLITDIMVIVLLNAPQSLCIKQRPCRNIALGIESVSALKCLATSSRDFAESEPRMMTCHPLRISFDIQGHRF